MASAAAAMQEKGVKVTGSDQNVYPPMSTFLAERKIEVINGYAERNLAHKPDLVVIGNAISRGNPEAEYRARPQAALLLAAGAAEGVFHSRQALARRRRHARQDHHDLAADLGLRAQRPEPELPHRRHPEQPRPGRAVHRQRVVHHRGRRIRHGVLRQAQQVRPLPARGRHHQQPRVRSRRHLREPRAPSRQPSSISSGSSRATACCWATATTRTSRRCST